MILECNQFFVIEVRKFLYSFFFVIDLRDNHPFQTINKNPNHKIQSNNPIQKHLQGKGRKRGL
jgi:hypothetical protein